MLKKQKINEIVKKIAAAVNPTRIILFGSYADGRATEESDLDLLVIVDDNGGQGEPGFKFKKAREIRRHLWGLTDTPKDILVYSEQEVREWGKVKFSFVSNILESGKVVYEN